MAYGSGEISDGDCRRDPGGGARVDVDAVTPRELTGVLAILRRVTPLPIAS